jgi:hypothetical protein
MTSPTGEPALPGDPLTQITRITATMTQVSGTLDEVAAGLLKAQAYERRTRRLTWGLLVSLILDVALTVVVSILSINAISQAQAVHQSQLAACAVGNQARADQLKLWAFLLATTAGNPGTNPAQLAQFRVFIGKTFKPVDCARVNRAGS